MFQIFKSKHFHMGHPIPLQSHREVKVEGEGGRICWERVAV